MQLPTIWRIPVVCSIWKHWNSCNNLRLWTSFSNSQVQILYVAWKKTICILVNRIQFSAVRKYYADRHVQWWDSNGQLCYLSIICIWIRNIFKIKTIKFDKWFTNYLLSTSINSQTLNRIHGLCFNERIMKNIVTLLCRLYLLSPFLCK